MLIFEDLYISLNEPGDEGEEGEPNGAAAAAEADNGDEPKPSPFRQGVEATAGRTEQDPDELPPVELDAEGKPVENPAETPPADEPPADDEAAAAAAKQKADDEFKAGVDAEVKELGLKGRTETRFRELTSKLRDQSDTIAEFEALREELPTLRASAEAAEKWEDALAATGAGQEQFGRLLGYAFAINKGTREQKIEAHTALKAELAWLEKEIGLKGDHYNPLDDHADLKARVESGDLDEADALELIESRQLKAGKERETVEQKAAREFEEAKTTATNDIAAFEADRKKNDPQYATKLRMLAPTIDLIARNLHPSKWGAEVRKAYAAINVPSVKDTVRAPIARQPVRPGPSHQNIEAPTKTNAFRFGVEKAKKVGR